MTDAYPRTVDLAEGRQTTVLGSLKGLDEVTIGGARREMAVVSVSRLGLA